MSNITYRVRCPNSGYVKTRTSHRIYTHACIRRVRDAGGDPMVSAIVRDQLGWIVTFHTSMAHAEREAARAQAASDRGREPLWIVDDIQIVPVEIETTP